MRLGFQYDDVFWIILVSKQDKKSMESVHCVLKRKIMLDGWFIIDVGVLRKSFHLFYGNYALPLTFVSQTVSSTS